VAEGGGNEMADENETERSCYALKNGRAWTREGNASPKNARAELLEYTFFNACACLWLGFCLARTKTQS